MEQDSEKAKSPNATIESNQEIQKNPESSKAADGMESSN
jgi:hypothetical protein